MREHLPRTLIGLVLVGVLAVGAYISVRSSLLWILGGRSFRFQTTAVYEAPATGYRLEIEAAGSVEAGDDLSERSEGTARISPLGEADRIPLRLTFSESDTLTVQFGDRSPETSTRFRRDRDSTLHSLLVRAGYERVDAAEVRESARAIDGALAGPKGTTMEGQSEALRVIRVSLRYPLDD